MPARGGIKGNEPCLMVSVMEPSGVDAGLASNEVHVKSTVRRFTTQYKLKVLKELENLPPGEIGQYLRKRGLFSSHITRWKKQAEDGSLSGKKAGRKSTRDYKSERISHLERQNQRLEKELKTAQLIIDVQKNCRICSRIKYRQLQRETT